jgi:hypothetical protein
MTNRNHAIYTQEGPDMIRPQRIKSALAATLALSAIAASSAVARPAAYLPSSSGSGTASTCTEVCSGGGYSTAPHAQLGPAHQTATPAHNTPSRSVADSSTAASAGGFDWGDAAIGAGGAVVILIVGAGGVHAAALRRSRHAGGVEVTAAS